MKNRKFFSFGNYRKLLKDFYYNQQGVYTVITALLSFVLLGIAALAVDGSGILLDKVRLTQGTEQAALALVAENNAFRNVKNHNDIARQKVSKGEINAAGNDEFKAKQEKRNQELIQGIVKTYLRTPHDNKDNSLDSLAEVTVDSKGFEYECEEVTNISGNSFDNPTRCYVKAEVNRKSWLYLNNSSLTFDKREKIDSGAVHAVKQRNILIPIDLVLVSDFSGSMNEPLAGTRWPAKITILREVVDEISKILLPQSNTADASPFNRIAFAAFAAGVQQRSKKDQCVYPYQGKSENTLLQFHIYSGYLIIDDKDKSNGRQKLQQYINQGILTKVIRLEQNGHYLVEGYPTRLMREIVKNLKARSLVTSHKNMLNQIFNHYIDMPKTIAQIANFNGKDINYDMEFPIDGYCLGEKLPRHGGNKVNRGINTSLGWFDQNNKQVTSELNKVEAAGGTAVHAGLLVGANILMDVNKEVEAQPSEVGINTQRIILILSDGEDNAPSTQSIITLINSGVCDAIRRKADSLQDPNVRRLPTRMAFVAFGYNLLKEHADAWKRCVGEENYYYADNKAKLLEVFRQVISINEEVGRLSN